MGPNGEAAFAVLKQEIPNHVTLSTDDQARSVTRSWGRFFGPGGGAQLHRPPKWIHEFGDGRNVAGSDPDDGTGDCGDADSW